MVSALDSQIDYLRQTRTSWLSIGRNYNDNDGAARGPSMIVLKSRLNEFAGEMGGIAARLTAESETNHLEDSRFMYMLGTSMAAWADQERDVLLVHCARLGQTNDPSAVFSQGRELFNLGLKDVERFRLVVAVLEDAFETDVLATRCESAQGRYKRGLPVLYGDRGLSAASAPENGLMATFFEGVNLNGNVIERKVATPRIDNYAPGGRREQWSARYDGDIQIAETGDWTLQCASDDGVRLIVDGKSILPENAWSAHSATSYKADLKLTNGWHPVVIEFFQGASDSKLQFLAGRKGRDLLEVPLPWLRPPSARQSRPAIETNIVLSAAAREALKERVHGGLQMAAAAPALVAPMTNEVENERLGRLVRGETACRPIAFK